MIQRYEAEMPQFSRLRQPLPNENPAYGPEPKYTSSEGNTQKINTSPDVVGQNQTMA